MNWEYRQFKAESLTDFERLSEEGWRMISCWKTEMKVYELGTIYPQWVAVMERPRKDDENWHCLQKK